MFFPLFCTEFLLGCVWDNRKLVCGVFDGYRLLTPHPMYDVTFQIPSHEPGTFRCVYISADEAVTVESCNLTLKGEALHPVVTHVQRDREKN